MWVHLPEIFQAAVNSLSQACDPVCLYLEVLQTSIEQQVLSASEGVP